MTTQSKSQVKRVAIQKKAADKKKTNVVQGNDAVIRVNMFLPEMEPKEHVIRIKNLKGRTTYSQRDPNKIASAIISGLTKKYGKLT